jgi:hypothetical protein
VQDCGAPQPLQRGARRHEPPGGVGDLLITAQRWVAFVLIGVEQGLRRVTTQHPGKFPGPVLDVVDGTVHTARAERGDQIRGIAHEKDPTMPQPIEQGLITTAPSQAST